MENKKTHIWYESRFWIILYAAVVALVMILQLVLGLLDSHQVVFRSQTLNGFVNGNIALPMATMSYAWTAIVSLYCVSDRAVDVLKTAKLRVGEVSMGDLAKLRGMILISLVLFLMALAFNFLTDRDYELAAWASAFAMTILSYTSGNKLVKTASWAGHHKDENQNGIPDEDEQAFDKWKRQQVKDGVDSEFITWDYFLDANPEIEKKYRSL